MVILLLLLLPRWVGYFTRCRTHDAEERSAGLGSISSWQEFFSFLFELPLEVFSGAEASSNLQPSQQQQEEEDGSRGF
ncbi:unnamed protein product [Lampetra fluviatilis]